MNGGRNFQAALLGLALFFSTAPAADPGAQPVLAGTIKDYVYPARDFTLKGARATPLPGRRLRLEEITVETRRTNFVNIFLSTPACEFDQSNQVVTSSSPLVVRSLDDRFQLQGQGYEFRPGTNRLLIHSNVVTRFDQQFLSRSRTLRIAPSPGVTNAATLRIASQSLFFDGLSGDVAYRRDVSLTDGDLLTGSAGELTLNIAAFTNETRQAVARENVRLRIKITNEFLAARADEAVFSAEPGIDARVQLAGHAAWQYGLLSGDAAVMRLTVVSNQFDFVGDGGANLRFPQTLVATNRPKGVASEPADPPWIDVSSASHQFAPGKLSFDGGVWARQGTNWAMSSRRFRVALDATNRPTRLEAAGDFVFEATQNGRSGRGTAGDAIMTFDAAGRQTVVLTGDPRWSADGFEKSADRITVSDPTGDPAYSGEGHVRMTLPGARLADFNWFGTQTNATEEKPRPVSTNIGPVFVTADRSDYRGGRAVLTGNVRVLQGTNSIKADELTMAFNPDRHLTNLVAAGSVTVRHGSVVLSAGKVTAWFEGTNSVLSRVEAVDDVRVCAGGDRGACRGTGRQMTYLPDVEEVRLEGQPELVLWPARKPQSKFEPAPLLYTGPQIIWNLRDESIGGKSPKIVTLPADVAIPRVCD